MSVFSFGKSRILRATGFASTLAALSLAAPRGPAQDADLPKPPPEPPPPIVTLEYQTLNNRQELKFKMAGKEYVRPVGDLRFVFPPGEFPSAGLDPVMRTFCVEPTLPIYAGETYQFAVERLDTPKSFALADNEAGQKLAAKKTSMIRELYGRYYQDTVTDPVVAAPAFQTAVWKIFHEQEIPDGPMPLNMFAGTFQADYPNEAESPLFVQRAQLYVQSLSGDEGLFLDNPVFIGLQPTRLTGMPTAAGFVPQSQLALRTTAAGGFPGGAPLVGALGAGPIGGVGGGGFAPVGGFGGFPFLPLGGAGGSNTSVPSTGSPGGSPVTTTPTGSSSAPSSTSPESAGNTGNQGPSQGGGGGTGETPPPNTPSPVPAPPAVLLGGIGLLVLAVARRLRPGRAAA